MSYAGEGTLVPAKPKILIVEDEGLIALDIESRVRKAGYEVAGVVDSGEAALEILAEISPDLILMDIRLRGELDGIETARLVQERWDLPVIYLTAHSDSDTVDRAKITGPFGYIAKPVSQASLPTTIEIALYKHRMERELRQQRAWLRTSLQTMSDAVIVTDHLGRIQYVNPSAERLTGWSFSEVLRLPLSQVLKLVHPLHGQWFSDASDASVLDGIPRVFPFGLRLVTRSDQQISVEGEIAPSTEDHTQLGAVITFRDVTAREREEQERRHEQKMEAVGRLAAGVAHDFNNFLTVILGHASLLLATGTTLDESTRQSIGEINHAGNSAAAITKQLLSFSRSPIAEPRQVSLSTLVLENEDLCRSLLGSNIAWETALDPQLESVYADPGQLAQVLINLVVNAVDAMPAGGTLKVSTENVEMGSFAGRESDLENHIVLTVADTGIGMDPTVAEHIFEPFFSTKRSGHGTGLGLSIVYNTVDQLGGVIAVDSKPGAGTTFRVFLPVAARNMGTRRSAPRCPGVITDGRKTILLVDDNEAVRAIMAKYLEASGYCVIAAADGTEALAVFTETDTPIDVLVTDIVMPKINGVRLAEELTMLQPDLKTIFVSGYAGDVLDRTNRLLADARFLQKPFLHSDLVQQVEELFAGRPLASLSTGWIV